MTTFQNKLCFILSFLKFKFTTIKKGKVSSDAVPVTQMQMFVKVWVSETTISNARDCQIL